MTRPRLAARYCSILPSHRARDPALRARTDDRRPVLEPPGHPPQGDPAPADMPQDRLEAALTSSHYAAITARLMSGRR